MEEIGTLRQLLLRHSSRAQLNKVLDYLSNKDKKAGRTVTREGTAAAYTPVVAELVRKPIVPPYAMPFIVAWCHDAVADEREPSERYVDVTLLNIAYEAPLKGLRPWGCAKNEAPPEGYYNINDSRHSKYFSLTFMKWSELIDTPVLDESGLLPHQILAEILWELTFSGWTEEERQDSLASIKHADDDAMKEIAEGKYIEFPLTPEEDYIVRVPDSVMEKLQEFTDDRSSF